MLDKKTVFLVVNDQEPMRNVIANQLRAMGANNIILASNGDEALRTLQDKPVDIVLANWNMPDMAGVDLLKTVRADAKLSLMPFILISTEAERYLIEEAIAAGVSDLLVKPYTATSLAERVEKALMSRPRSSSITRQKPAVAADMARQTILVVDDSADNLLLLSHLFSKEYLVHTTQSGQEALAICQSNTPPDLVLLDIMMPGMDGFEVARLMREHPTSETIPVIFVTAWTGENERRKGLELGAVDFVTKPIDLDAIKLLVHNFMRYAALHKQLQANYDGMLELARLREQVVHITLHDMKGPLAGVIGLVQALAYDNLLNPEQIEQLHKAVNNALEELDMINLSSELFKIETGSFRLYPQKVKIGDILSRIVDIAQTTFAEKHITVAFDTNVPTGENEPHALGNAMFCYSMFHNLVKNACEAAPANSRVVVTLADGSPLRITILNHGTVPSDIREQFFGKFVTRSNVGGTGLGAYSAKMLTEAQHGTIALKVSDYQNQTTITVTLPRYDLCA